MAQLLEGTEVTVVVVPLVPTARLPEGAMREPTRRQGRAVAVSGVAGEVVTGAAGG